MAKKIVKYTVGKEEHEAEKGASLLGELRKHGYVVPSLCYHESLTAYGACRLCLVEVRKGTVARSRRVVLRAGKRHTLSFRLGPAGK